MLIMLDAHPFQEAEAQAIASVAGSWPQRGELTVLRCCSLVSRNALLPVPVSHLHHRGCSSSR